MVTRILDLQPVTFDFAIGNNEDWSDSWPYLDSSLNSVFVNSPGAGFVSGSTSVFFGVSPTGHTALGTATIVAGGVSAVSLSDPGFGYSPILPPQVSFFGAGTGAFASAIVGNPIPLTGIAATFMMRTTADSPDVALIATTQGIEYTVPNGNLVIGTGGNSNILGISVPLAQMNKITAGSYVFEVRASADNSSKVIARGNVVVKQGVVLP